MFTRMEDTSKLFLLYSTLKRYSDIKSDVHDKPTVFIYSKNPSTCLF